jgi:hypothetical protein
MHPAGWKYTPALRTAAPVAVSSLVVSIACPSFSAPERGVSRLASSCCSSGTAASLSDTRALVDSPTSWGSSIIAPDQPKVIKEARRAADGTVRVNPNELDAAELEASMVKAVFEAIIGFLH